VTTEIQTDAAPAATDDFDSAFAEFSAQRDEPTNESAIDATASEGDGDTTTTEEPSEPELSAADLKAQLDAERKRAEEYEHKFKSEVGRQTALQRQIQELQAQQNKAPQEAPQKSRSAAMQKLLEDFPEIAEALESEIDSRLGSVKKEVDQQLQPFAQKASKDAYAAQEAATLEVYPNMKQLVNTPEFANWLPAQPAAVQALAASPIASDAVALLDYFTGGKRPDKGVSEVQSIKEKREQQLNRHVSVRNTAPAPVADAPDDFESAFRHFSAKRERQAARR
jgi:hypothetical protein